MNKPSFLPEKEEQKQSNKGDFKSKCTTILEKIKEIDEGKYHELNTIFHSRYFKDNIRKNVIVGFYGQLVNELKALKPTEATPMVATPPKAKPAPKPKMAPKVAKEETKKTTKKVAKEETKKTTKKVAKKETKKTTKKVAKKVTKKTTKKVAKKVTKKTTKKATKKTTKKKR